jgi:hypothetical protein
VLRELIRSGQRGRSSRSDVLGECCLFMIMVGNFGASSLEGSLLKLRSGGDVPRRV